jgi:hypothetical protein
VRLVRVEMVIVVPDTAESWIDFVSAGGQAVVETGIEVRSFAAEVIQ